MSCPTTRFVPDLATSLSRVLEAQAGSRRSVYLYGAARLAVEQGGARQWYTTDHVGSPRLMVDNAGAAISARHFDPWGQPTASTQPGRFGFTGEPQDTAMGLVHLRARWYQPGTGRFLSVDPFAGWTTRPYSQHPYQYGYSNPLRYTDPSGQAAGAGNITVVCATLIAADLGLPFGDLGCVVLVAGAGAASLYASYTIATHTGVLDGGGNHTTCDPCQIELDPEQDVFPEVFPPPRDTQDAIPSLPGMALDPPSLGDTIHGTPLDRSVPPLITDGLTPLPPALRDGPFHPKRFPLSGALNCPPLFMANKSKDNPWRFNPEVDLDWRGTDKTVRDAIAEAFRRTGVPRKEFEVKKWSKDVYGKSHPVEWRIEIGPKRGAEVNIDDAHILEEGPPIPHVGYQTPGKFKRGERKRGHILLDDVPWHRAPKASYKKR